MADAAKAARGSFNDIKTSAGEMGAGVRYSMRESRESIMAVGEMFGVHLPASITRTIAGLEMLGPALAAALPFAAVAVGAVLLMEHMRKVREESEKLTESQANFGITSANALNTLDEKLLQAGIRADDLGGNHLAALEKQLKVIDLTRMDDLQKALNELVKESDAVLGNLESGWIVLGTKALGYKDSLERIKQQYDTLLANKDEKGANAFLDSQIDREKKILELKEKANKSQHANTVDPATFAAMRELQQMDSSGNTDKDVMAQRQVVASLDQMIERRKRYNELSTMERKNTSTEDAQREATARESGLNKTWKAYEEWVKFQESSQERINSLGLEGIALGDRIAREKAETEIKANTLVEKAYLASQQKQTDDALVQQHSAQDKLEQMHALGLISETAYFAQLKEIYRREHDAKMASLQTEMSQTVDPDRQLRIQQQMTAETIRYNSELTKTNTAAAVWQRTFNTIADGVSHSFATMITQGKSFTQSMSQMAAQMTEHWIESLMKQMVAHEMTTAAHIVGNHAAAASDKTTSAASQLASAKSAAAKAFEAGWHFPFPVNIAMAPALGAMAFVTAMAFEKGGIVPGVGVGDTVPAMLTPGESVLPKALTEHLTNAAKFGNTGGDGGHVHLHHSPTYHVHAIDGPSVEGMLKQHNDTFTKHFHSQVRRMNKR